MSANASFDLESIANLARLELNEDESESLGKDMERIVEYVNSLSALDVEGVEPMAHAVALTNVIRDDESEPSPPRGVFMANAPEVIDDDELVKVPKVIDGGA